MCVPHSLCFCGLMLLLIFAFFFSHVAVFLCFSQYHTFIDIWSAAQRTVYYIFIRFDDPYDAMSFIFNTINIRGGFVNLLLIFVWTPMPTTIIRVLDDDISFSSVCAIAAPVTHHSFFTQNFVGGMSAYTLKWCQASLYAFVLKKTHHKLE